MTEHRTWNPDTDDELPPFWWLAQQWHWLWRLDGELSDRKNAYYCAWVELLEREYARSRERA